MQPVGDRYRGVDMRPAVPTDPDELTVPELLFEGAPDCVHAGRIGFQERFCRDTLNRHGDEMRNRGCRDDGPVIGGAVFSDVVSSGVVSVDYPIRKDRSSSRRRRG